MLYGSKHKCTTALDYLLHYYACVRLQSSVPVLLASAQKRVHLWVLHNTLDIIPCFSADIYVYKLPERSQAQTHSASFLHAESTLLLPIMLQNRFRRQ